MNKSKGQADEKIEVTPEMIEAGIEELALFERFDPGSWIVVAVYREMERVRRLKQLRSK